MDKKLIDILRCPECHGTLEFMDNGTIIECRTCDFDTSDSEDYVPLISKVDLLKYSWLEQLNKEDRPEYHSVDDRVYDKEQYAASGYLDRLFLEISPKKEDVVLDLGCGRGNISDPLRLLVDTVISIDLVPDNLRDVENPNSFLATADNIPLSNNSVDLVIFTDVLEHLPPEMEAKVLAEIYRVIRPGGRFLISYPGNNLPNLTGVHILNLVIFFIRLFDKRVRYMGWREPPAHINMSYPWKISRSFRSAGFKGDIRPYANKFLSLPPRYHLLAKVLNLPVVRMLFVHQMHGLLSKSD